MIFKETSLPGVIIVQPEPISDHRGHLMETFRASLFEEYGIPANFVQENQVWSKRNTLRGLHYQVMQPQGKLIRVTEGLIFSVIVDVRKNSDFFGKWFGMNMSDDHECQLWIPPGCAYGYYVMSEYSKVILKTTAEYEEEWKRTIIFSDPLLSISWPLDSREYPVLSEDDRTGCLLIDAELYG